MSSMFGNLKSIPRTPFWLGLSGALPFAAGMIVYALGGVWVLDQDFAVRSTLAYGAVILSFLGGVRWGLALLMQFDEKRDARLALSILPSLLGWVALLMPHFPALVLLAMAFAAQGAWDAGDVADDGAPDWYATLRTVLTALVCSLLSVLAVLTIV
ncbi:MAG: DUF3429 domain-containing protein [Devosiaceae bacterium]|nr:DUF3429 domain-containing protein [Devosiaceae bacterium MH13]